MQWGRLLAKFSPSPLIAIFLVAASLQTPQLWAGDAGQDALQGCIGIDDELIPSEYDPDLGVFARVIVVGSQDQPYYIIEVNPTFYFLSTLSQRWLYLRQCANINLGHQAIHGRSSRPNLREERAADCWAIEELADEAGFISERDVITIQRDLERLDSEQWQRVFGGPRRRTDLSRCLYEPADDY